MGGAKAMHWIPAFTGVAGIGKVVILIYSFFLFFFSVTNIISVKTTLTEASAQHILDKFNSIESCFSSDYATKKVIRLTIDFSNGCHLGVLDARLSPSVVVGL